MTAHKQTTEGGDPAGYSTAYTYNLAGALIEETYPSGRVVKNVLDNDGDLSMVQSKKGANQGFWNYAQNFTYSAAGAVTSVQLGNGRWESTLFNSRLQPTRIALGTTVGAFDLLKLDYEYGDWAAGGTVDATKNNGNIAQQTVTVPNSPGHADAFTATQKYYYDPLNRVDDSTEEINNSQTWRQDFSYDRYGNRSLVEANTTTIPRSCGTAPDLSVCTDDRKRLNPAIDVSNNRLSAADGYQYEPAGNTAKDPQSRKFTYDAENKQTKVETVDTNGAVTGTVGEYFYDGDGKRVKKYVPSTGEVTIFVYDAAGKEIAEYSTVVASQTEAKVAYLTNDHLGSPRINTDQTGAVTARHDYHPFGEEISTPQRAATLGYVADSVRKQFTGYERDAETELDFAEARYLNSSVARFTSPDDFLSDTRATNPQSWNLYIYVRNNPLKYNDPTGEKVFVSFDDTDDDGNVRTVRLEYKGGKLYTADGKEYTGNNEYALKALNYLNTLSQDKVLGAMIDDLVKSKKEHTITRNADDPDKNQYVPNANGGTVYWSGETATVFNRTSHSRELASNTFPAIGVLAHELLGHGWFIDRGIERQGWVDDVWYENGLRHVAPQHEWEVDAINVENRARKLLGLTPRVFAGGSDISEYVIEDFNPRAANPWHDSRKPIIRVSPRSKPR